MRQAPRAAALAAAAALLSSACAKSTLPAYTARGYRLAAGREGPQSDADAARARASEALYDEADRELGPRPAPPPAAPEPERAPPPPKASVPPAPEAPKRRPARAPSELVSRDGRKAYAAVRAAEAPRIDGVLDDRSWRVAPEDSRFVNPKSEPHGIPSRQPTSFQVAYDAENLYIAVRCWDPDPGDHDASASLDEARTATLAESVTVFIDGRRGRHHARAFTVAKSGDRADAEIGDDGRRVDYEWRGAWQSAVVAKPASWTAEIAVPFRTLDVPPGEGPGAIGLEVQRHIPSAGGAVAVWQLAPPAFGAEPPPSYFGDLVGVSGVAAPPALYLRPYIAVGGRLPPDQSTFGRLPLSRLRDFASDSDKALLYAGLDARVRPIEPVTIDVAVNPDFTQVSPDSVVANLDRFEPSFPEVRPFFEEDKTRFELGAPGAELYYSRRIGLKPKGATRFEEVPVLYAVRGRVEHQGTYVGAMNVGLSTPRPAISIDDEDTIVRVEHDFGHQDRIGTLFLQRRGDFVRYLATGVDGAYSLVDEHLVLSGFAARTQTDGRASGMAGNVAARWASRETQVEVAYLDIGKDFDPELGYFPLTGIRTGHFLLGYTPQIRNDFVGVLALSASLDRTRDREERLVYDRAAIRASAVLLNAATIEVRARPSVEGVTDGFKIGGGRILIEPGKYKQLGLDFSVRSPPRGALELGAGYTEGDLWDGYMRQPWAEVGVNLGPFTAAIEYKLLLVRASGKELDSHLVGGRALYAFTPRLRASLDVRMNGFDPRAAVHAVGSYGFGDGSTVLLVLSQSADTVSLWGSDPDRRAVLSFAYGLSLF